MRAPKVRCGRHAPTPVSEEQMASAGTIWPSTFDDDWCGEGRHAAAPELNKGNLGDRDLGDPYPGDSYPGDSIAKGNSPPERI